MTWEELLTSPPQTYTAEELRQYFQQLQEEETDG